MITLYDETYNRSSQILLGFECLRPSNPLIFKIRCAMETLTYKKEDYDQIIDDFIEIMKVSDIAPTPSAFRSLLLAQNADDQLESVLRIISYWLAQEGGPAAALDSGVADEHKVYGEIKNLIDETDAFLKIKKTLDFLNFLRPNPLLPLLKKAYEHYVSLNSELQFFAFLHKACDLPLLDNIKYLRYQGENTRFEEALSKGQVKSKMWVLEEFRNLKIQPESALVLCGWFGILPFMLFEQGVKSIVSLDIDPACAPLAKRLNHSSSEEGRFRAITADIFDIDYNSFGFNLSQKETPFDIVINTSCEHIENFEEWYEKIPGGQLLALQSNDYFDCDEHVNCVNSTAEFRDQTPMRQRLFSGALPLEKYTRYMVIGYK